MGGEAALKQGAGSREQGAGSREQGAGSKESAKKTADKYDEGLFDRFMRYREYAGATDGMIAKKIGRSATQVSQYVNQKFVGDLGGFERDLAALLRREEDLQFISDEIPFITTTPAKLMWEVMQYCDERRKMGLILAPSGTGKSRTCEEYKKHNPATVFVTSHIRTGTANATLKLIAKAIMGAIYKYSICDLLDEVIGKLRNSNRMILIDDAHFLSWEAFEIVRKIYDCGHVPIVYVGQEKLYEQMKGTDKNGYLFDQIYSRIAIKRDKFHFKKNDLRAFADVICPGLDKACIDYLFGKIKAKGRIRPIKNLIELTMTMSKEHNLPINLDLFVKAEMFSWNERRP